MTNLGSISWRACCLLQSSRLQLQNTFLRRHQGFVRCQSGIASTDRDSDDNREESKYSWLNLDPRVEPPRILITGEYLFVAYYCQRS